MSLEQTIDRSSPVPYYYQLRQLLERAITDGGLSVGDRLPSESALCSTYGVSRTVVRQALADLESASLIVRYKGKGSFVAAPKVSERLVQALTSLHEDVATRGGQLDTRVLRLEEEPVSPHVADLLGLDEAQRIVLLERLRFVDGEPWELTTVHLPLDLAAPLLELDMASRSLYATLERELGLKLHHGRRSVEATLAGPEAARRLQLDERAPLLLLRGVTYLDDGRPVEYFTSFHRADRSRFEVHLVRPPAHEHQAFRGGVVVATGAREGRRFGG